jgi:spermidine/putrescine transport system substrate-binding protein
MPFSRRSFLAATAGAVVAAPTLARSQTTSGKYSGQTLVVASWAHYGDDDPASLKRFEEMTGANVKNVYFTSEDGLLEMLRQGGLGKIDVTLPNLEYVLAGAKEGLFQPLDVSRVKTWASLEGRFRNVASIRYNGQIYAVPWVQGATSLTVNPTLVNPVPTSWKVLWDPANKGKVAFFDDPTTAVMTAALYLGIDPQNPDLDKIRKALLDLKSNVRLFWSSADDWNKAYLTGAITMGNLWSGLAGTLKSNGHPLEFILPPEGTVVWVDTWAIANNTPRLDLAYEWINFLTSKEYFVDWITHPGPNQQLAVPVNIDAIDALPKAAADRLQAYKIAHYSGPMALQAGISPDLLKSWTELWEEVKAA